MKKYYVKFLIAFLLGELFFSISLIGQGYAGYTLLWSDEFNGGYSNADAETGLDLDAWNFETGGGGWGTGQYDYATRDVENVQVSDGTLKIRTQRNHPNQSNEYTSGRINSKNKQAFLYGKVEARIRTHNMTESGRGFAFWMMPNTLPAGDSYLMWPQGGEIDIFEYNGLYPQYNLGSVHYAWRWNQNNWGGDANHAHAGGIYNPIDRTVQYVAQGRDGCSGPGMSTDKTHLLGANYHVYGINWYNDRIEFYVDQDVFHTFYINKENWCGDAKTNDLGNRYIETGYDFSKLLEGSSLNDYFRTFENPFYIILSAGVGGNGTYGGNINNGNNPSTWTCTTEIDWVRAYKKNDVNPPIIEFAQNQYEVSAGNVTVTPTKLSGDNISKIEYFVNKWDAKAKLATGSSFVWNATNGCHTLYVRACNAAGYWGNWVKVKYSVGGACGTASNYDYWVIYRDNLNNLNGTVLDCRNGVDDNWNDLVASSTCSPIEGTASMCYDTRNAAQAWWLGRYVPSTKSYDLSGLEQYYLHLRVRTNYPYPIKLVIKENDSSEGSYMLSTSSGNGYTIDNQWRKIEIPLSSFSNMDFENNKASTFLFGFYPTEWNTANSFSKHIELDDIYFYKGSSVELQTLSKNKSLIMHSDNNVLTVENAPLGEELKIYTINGMLKYVGVISSESFSVSMPAGFYIVQCQDAVEKLIIN